MKIAPFIFLMITAKGVGQNAGIGTSDLSKAKFTVVSNAQNVNRSRTISQFGLGSAGVSFLESIPTIGLNQRAGKLGSPDSVFLAGYPTLMQLNHQTGVFEMKTTWSAVSSKIDTYYDPYLTYEYLSNQLTLRADLTGKPWISIPDTVFASNTGALNLVPLGIYSISFEYSKISGTYVYCKTGMAVSQNCSISNTSNRHVITFSIPGLLSNIYKKLVILHGVSFDQEQPGLVKDWKVDYELGNKNEIYFTITPENFMGQYFYAAQCQMIVYGMK